MLLRLSTAWAGESLQVYSDLDDFNIPLDRFAVDIEWKGEASVPMYITISPDSLTWRWLDDGNKLPQLILAVTLQSQRPIRFRYKNQVYIPEQKGADEKRLFLTVDVFSNDVVWIVEGRNELGMIRVSPDDDYFRHHYVYLHHSCLPFELNLSGIKDRYSSLSCDFHPGPRRIGILDVSFLPAESRLEDDSDPPYRLQFTGDSMTRIDLALKNNESFQVGLNARVPNYVPQFKTALGYGPYYFEAEANGERVAEHLTASYMIYGKYDMSKTASFRFFDALLNSGSLFNNLGGYFAYEVGSTADRRLIVVPLLGFQSISFRKSKNDRLFHQLIYPQGGELVYRHAFGWQNYHLIYGMFISTMEKVRYENIWLRFGKRVFWEVNLINWQFEHRRAHMWGLSVGLPFLSF